MRLIGIWRKKERELITTPPFGLDLFVVYMPPVATQDCRAEMLNAGIPVTQQTIPLGQ